MVMLETVLWSVFVFIITFVTTTRSCQFTVESVREDQQLLAKQVQYAKEQLMQTSWKLDTSVIYSLYDTDKDSNLDNRELHAILLLAHLGGNGNDDGIYEASNISSSLIVVGDEDGDNKLTVTEFNRLFGLHTPIKSRRHRSPLLTKLSAHQ